MNEPRIELNNKECVIFLRVLKMKLEEGQYEWYGDSIGEAIDRGAKALETLDREAEGEE